MTWQGLIGGTHFRPPMQLHSSSLLRCAWWPLYCKCECDYSERLPVLCQSRSNQFWGGTAGVGGSIKMQINVLLNSTLAAKLNQKLCPNNLSLVSRELTNSFATSFKFNKSVFSLWIFKIIISLSLFCILVVLRYVFTLHKLEKERSEVALVAGIVNNSFIKTQTLEKASCW